MLKFKLISNITTAQKGIKMHVLALLMIAMPVLLPLTARATAITETPWRVDVAAYRVTSFYCALVPLPWAKVEQAWSAPLRGVKTSKTAFQLLKSWPTAASLIPDIQQAIEANDKQALFESSTRAISRAMLAALDAAAQDTSTLETANPVVNLSVAREYYRTFEDYIQQTDPAGFRELGMAWLELSSSIGSRGLVGVGNVAADQTRFNQARSVVVEYIKANFDPTEFTSRSNCQPVPELKAAQGTVFKLNATLPPGSFIGDQSPLPLLVLNFEERGIEETDVPLIAYGDMLFDSPQIFGEPAKGLGISCASCHNRSDINQAFFIPGISHQAGSVDVDSAFFNPIVNDLRDDPIDIPSLRGLRFTGPYGRDGRFASLRDFTRNVIVKEFAGSEPSPFMLDALIAYMDEFDFLPNSLLSASGELSDAVSESTQRGELLFKQPFAQMDGKSCASCHAPASNFVDYMRHDIGTVSAAYTDARAGAMDTPTLLGSVFTAPYFHDGSQPTLASVVTWFDEQFGLGLTASEKEDLSSYLNVIGSADNPYEQFDQQNTPFRLFFDELTTFASTLDTLIPLQDKEHARLLIDTVTSDLTLDASVMENLDSKLEIYQLSESLSTVGIAVDNEDWDDANRKWQKFKELLVSVDKQAY